MICPGDGMAHQPRLVSVAERSPGVGGGSRHGRLRHRDPLAAPSPHACPRYRGVTRSPTHGASRRSSHVVCSEVGLDGRGGACPEIAPQGSLGVGGDPRPVPLELVFGIAPFFIHTSISTRSQGSAWEKMPGREAAEPRLRGGRFGRCPTPLGYRKKGAPSPSEPRRGGTALPTRGTPQPPERTAQVHSSSVSINTP